MSSVKVVPGVVLRTRFVLSGRSDFKNYVDYVDREEAKNEKQLNEKMFSLYQDYMGNSEKTSSLFTEKSNRLSELEKKQLKNLFKTAQENNSIMWQDVISFRNDWLEEHGIYDAKTKTLDEEKLMNATRLSMKEMMKREGIDKTAIWSGAIHYNTDNIHIHIATVEPYPTRERGKRKPKTLDAMKSKIINNILDRSQEQKMINDLIRKNIVDHKKEDSTLSWRNREMKPLFHYIYNHLPADKRQWQYSYNSLQPLRPYLDELSRKYIEKYHKQDYEQFIKRLDKEVEVLKQAYGEGKFDRKRYEDYKQNKIDELYKRMGNTFLKEMRDFDKVQQRVKKVLEGRRAENPKYQKFQRNISIHYAMRKVERAFRSDYESWKNQRHYERLEREIEYQKEAERGY